LTALEVLQAWHAPVGAVVDPWNPESITPVLVAELRQWAKNVPENGDAELSDEQRNLLLTDLARFLKAEDDEAFVIRERLARFGGAVRDEINRRLADSGANSDRERERLLALRYRLAATPALAAQWPSGFERLASTKQAVRHQAIKELEPRATLQDEGLLLELFAHPDSLVREISLRILNQRSDKKISEALLKLLYDPDANVRTAVLKQMIEAPTPNLIPKLVEYLRWEKEVDLIVNAVRVLRELNSAPAGEGLLPMTKHPNWAVRAEAVEGLVKILGSIGNSPGSDADSVWAADLKKRGQAAVIARLDDADGFVVGKVLAGVRDLSDDGTLELLLKVPKNHPDLTVKIVDTLGQLASESDKIHPALRDFFRDPRADVRKAALAGLVQAATAKASRLINPSRTYGHFSNDPLPKKKPWEEVVVPLDEIAKDIEAGLKDVDTLVRQAALKGVLDVCGTCVTYAQPGNNNYYYYGAFDRSAVDGFQKGANWPKWLKELRPSFDPFVKAKDASERTAAAGVVVALGDHALGFPVLVAAARGDEKDLWEATRYLGWIADADHQKQYAEQLIPLADNSEKLAGVVRWLGSLHADFVPARLWQLVDDGRVDEKTIGSFHSVFNSDYASSGENLSENRKSPATVKRVLADTLPRLSKGNEGARFLAIYLLAETDTSLALGNFPPDAEIKGSLVHRRDMALLELIVAPQKKADDIALKLLTNETADLRRVGLMWLTRSYADQTHQYFRNGELHWYADDLQYRHTNARQAQFPRLPSDLQVEALLPLLKDSDPHSAAAAGFLLVAKDRPEGWEPLYRAWRSTAFDVKLTRMVFTAAALLGDDSRVPILEEIYRHYVEHNNYSIPAFYWTIRIMDGPRVLRLRKTIRDEYGMQNLQQTNY
jgi:HEAT repeat protein